MLRQLRKGGVLSFEHKGGYVQSITCGGKTLAELDEGKNSGWLYTVNGELPDVYMSAYGLKKRRQRPRLLHQGLHEGAGRGPLEAGHAGHEDGDGHECGRLGHEDRDEVRRHDR